MTDVVAVAGRRHRALWALRRWLVGRDFIEVDTPQLVASPGLEPHIDPLAVDVRLDFHGAHARRYLITSPELACKRLLAAGVPRLFQLGHVFRDGERTARHAPEFTLLEWYRAGGTLDDLVDDVAGMAAAVASADVAPPQGGSAAASCLARTPYQRATVAALLHEHAGVDLAACLDERGDFRPGALRQAAAGAGLSLRPGADDEDAFAALMDQRVEPAIGRDRPVVVGRWPACMAVLARRAADDSRFAERFEIYAGGLELCNAFDELTDADEQRARFEADNRRRRQLGKPTLPLDERFLAALPSMPPSVGCALGVERLLMLAWGAGVIDDVVPLPFE